MPLLEIPDFNAKENKLVMKLGGKKYDGWERVSIHRNIEAMSGHFAISLTDRFIPTNKTFPITPGESVQLYIGSDLVMTGFLDRVEVSSTPEGRQVEVSGRDKTGELIDNAATIQAQEIKDQKFNEIVKMLAAKYSVSVVDNVGSFSAIDKTQINLGDSVSQVIEKIARNQGVLMYPDPQGRLVIAKIGQTRASTKIKQGENTKSASAFFDETDRFSTYKVVTHNVIAPLDKTGAPQPNIAETAKDAGCSRSFRTKFIVGEDMMTIAQAQKRAQWEATTRAARAFGVNVELAGWRQTNGKLWTINQLCVVDLPFVFIKRTMLISAVEYQKSQSAGTTTRLTLMRKDAFQPEPQVPKGQIVDLGAK